MHTGIYGGVICAEGHVGGARGARGAPLKVVELGQLVHLSFIDRRVESN